MLLAHATGIVAATVVPGLAQAEREARASGTVPPGWVRGADCSAAGCHPNVARSRHVHGAVTEFGCDTCHEETGDHLFEPPASSPESCLDCHDEGTGLQWEHGGGSAECADCHDPHASMWRGLLLLPADRLCQDCHVLGEGRPDSLVHDPVRRGDCLACHHPHHASTRPLLARTFRDTCARCHDRIVDPPGRDPDPHAAMEDGEGCVNCHEIHEAEFPRLLSGRYSRARYTADPMSDFDLCFTCHDEEDLLRSGESGFVDGNGRNLHGAHVLIEGKGRGCGTCHRMHETSLPHMLAPRSTMGRWHPALEFRTGEAENTCAPACHEPRSYPASR